MDLKLKTISKSGIGEAIAKAELYRYLNEPEEAESICRDILAADPQNMLGMRMLGLSITDQFEGRPSDRYGEVERIFDGLAGSVRTVLLHGAALRAAGEGAASRWGVRRIRCCRCSSGRCNVLRRRRRFGLRAMMIRSCGGIGACGCCRASRILSRKKRLRWRLGIVHRIEAVTGDWRSEASS